MKFKAFWIFFLIVASGLLSSCGSSLPDPDTPCSERSVLFCEDFEGINPQIETSQLVDSTAFDQWWVTSDDDREYLYQDFPQAGRTRNNLIVLASGQYQNGSTSFLYTREIDLSSAARASLSYNLIYRTERNWDGLTVFAVRGGASGAGDPENWILVAPASGYPGRVLMNGVLVPGYSGISPGWIHQEIDLTPLVGSSYILGFYFTADLYENGWGAALDDIILEADRGSIASDTAGLIDLPLDSILLPEDPLISLDLPRANALGQTPCLSGKQEILAESQRAVIKAVSQSEDFYLILHPESGSLCWVKQEDIWIDGETVDLPRLTEKEVVSYAPIMPYRQSPALIDAACRSGIEADLPLRIDAALVEEGEITRLLFMPVLAGDVLPEVFEPRVGKSDEMPDAEAAPCPGGLYWLQQGGASYPCQPDRIQAGRVICQDLALDQGQLSGLELCWRGWDQSQACPPGFYLDPDSEGCVPDDGSSACEPACGDGFLFDPGSGSCLVDRSSAAVTEDPNSCPPGYLFNPAARTCVGSEYSLETNCPLGTYYSPDLGSCLALEEPESCPEGYSMAIGPGYCLPENSQAPILCQNVEVSLPTLEVTVKKASRCLKEPGNPNEIVSSLNPFDKADILGLGADGETLVIINPAYQIPCWAPLDNFYLEKIDLEILAVIPSN